MTMQTYGYNKSPMSKTTSSKPSSSTGSKSSVHTTSSTLNLIKKPEIPPALVAIADNVISSACKCLVTTPTTTITTTPSPSISIIQVSASPVLSTSTLTVSTSIQQVRIQKWSLLQELYCRHFSAQTNIVQINIVTDVSIVFVTVSDLIPHTTVLLIF
jgi:hypothetical protein